MRLQLRKWEFTQERCSAMPAPDRLLHAPPKLPPEMKQSVMRTFHAEVMSTPFDQRLVSSDEIATFRITTDGSK